MHTLYDVHQLALNGDTAFLDLLAAGYIDPTLLNKQEQSPIYSAIILPALCSQAQKEQKTKIFNELFAKDVTILSHQDTSGETILHYLARFGYEEVLQKIISSSLDLSAFFIHGKWGKYPIHDAILNGYEAIFKQLLPLKSKINDTTLDMASIIDGNGQSLLHYVAQYGSAPLVAHYCDKISSTIDDYINQEDVNGETPLSLAMNHRISSDKDNIAEILMDHGASRASTYSFTG